ncbi:capsule assembly Wzi family protein [Gramella jeungdoensis]|uniref:Capsule assembly Wzi family protein n=1 Tax=Gramella jeungdoensis TaxID=708091 RepID=A0ABT0Z6R0_9FLAO|nr:capsule assembly Wzi family protein [Gramella jeungdoensis]MCM8570464.1 capsule assembly Wzi family protein [Gramella jeungdoensis]
MRIKILAIFLLFLSSELSAQIIDYNFDFEGTGQLYTGDRSPFWMHANKKGRLDEKSHLFSLLSGVGDIQITDSTYFRLGAGVLYKDGYEDGVKLDEAYFEYTSPKLGVVMGKKHKEDLFQGLSASNENILWSLNSSAIPGIKVFTRSPLFLRKNHGIGFMAALEEYLLDDDRYVEKTRLHHKSFHIIYQGHSDFRIALGVQHFVQWAGISPEYGKLPNSFEDYIKVVTGTSGDPVGGEEVNALGNQIGSYEVKLKTKVKGFDLQFLYNHIFEDASGMKMGNFPDGRYAIFIEDNRDPFWGTPWLKTFMYEFYYTKNQSRDRVSSKRDGADNYFNNNLYRTGWVYKNQVIGVPFILLNEDRFRIGTNIIAVHHLGVKGKVFNEFPYRLLLSYRQNYGVKDSFFPEKREILSTFLELDLIDSDYKLKAQVGADISSYQDSNFGVGLNFTKTIF